MKARLDSIASLFSLAVLLAWLSIIPTAYATTYTTVAAGDWTSSSTWEGGLNDYGDAPASYGEAKHKIPVTPSIYLGANVLDDEPSSQNSANADGDNADGTDDENAFSSLPDLVTTATSYSLNVPCAGSGTVAGWIDFDRSGAFTNSGPNERASAACSSGTATLTWNSANGNFPASLPVGSTHVRLRIASVAGEVANPTGTANDGEVEDYKLIMTCAGLTGDVSEAPLALPMQIASGDKVFVASRSPAPNIEGHLKAYAVQTDGSVSTTAAWDAATLMNNTKRQNGLYSTDAAGAKILFNSLDDVAFSTTTPSVATVKAYTLDPSYSGGTYLAGRKSGSFLGAISRDNDLALLTQLNNMSLYLEDAAYRTLYSGTVATRDKKVLVSSDDGFLYAFNQSDGELAWGWMPRTLVTELKNYSTFQNNLFMRGKLDIIDAKNAGAYATYVVGGYKNGLGHYVLKLSSSAGLDSVVWDEDRSGSFSTAPNHGEMDYFRDGSGNTYVTYVLTTSANTSTLVIRNLATETTTDVTLNFNATSTPFVMPDFGDTNGPAAKTLYLGDSNGNIRRAALLSSGALASAASIQSALQNTTYTGELGAAEPILFLGAARSAWGGNYYLRAQSNSRLTVLQYDASTTHWKKRWTSYVGGAGTWDAAGTTYTADNSGAPTDTDGDGVATNVTANGIQWLPTGAAITDAAQIIADSIILPVSVTASGACYGKAFYYLYRLTDGAFPDNKFFRFNSSTTYAENLFLGYGNPTSVEIGDMPSKERLIGHGHADQTPSNAVGIPTSFIVNDPVATGIRGWKELQW